VIVAVIGPCRVAGAVSVAPLSPTAVTVGKPRSVHVVPEMLVNCSELSDFIMPLPPWSTWRTDSWLVAVEPVGAADSDQRCMSPAVGSPVRGLLGTTYT
jgi:hypothetical protein